MRKMLVGAAVAVACSGCLGAGSGPMPGAPLASPGVGPTASGPSPAGAPAQGSGAPGAVADVAAQVSPSVASRPAAGAADAAARRFAYDLYAQLALRTTDALVVSPWSAWVALSMTALGASEANRDAALHLLRATDLGDPHTQIGALMRRLERDAGAAITWQNANRVYVDAASHAALRAPFVDQLAQAYGGTVGLASFASDPEAARQTINAWVGEQTRERIPTLLAQGVITTQTVLVLINAVYFLAPWQVAFDPASTTQADFRASTRAGTETVQVPTMYRSGQLAIADAEGVVAFRLPYTGEAFEMVVVVPPDGGLAAAEALLTAGALDPGGALAAFVAQPARLWMPRFTLRTSGSLMAPLRDIGLAEVERTGPFDQVLEGDPLVISDVIQEAFIEVTEQGTEAAAATAVVMTRSAAVRPAIREVRVDRPFLVVVRHAATAVPLFIARVNDPR